MIAYIYIYMYVYIYASTYICIYIYTYYAIIYVILFEIISVMQHEKRLPLKLTGKSNHKLGSQIYETTRRKSRTPGAGILFSDSFPGWWFQHI